MKRSFLDGKEELQKKMNALVSEYGSDDVGRAYSGAVYEELYRHLERRYGNSHPVRRISEMLPWPRHLLYSDDHNGVMDWENHRPPGADHDSVFKDTSGKFTFVTEPYSLCDKNFFELADYCKEHNLSVKISTGSPHYPTRCLVIALRKNDA